MTTQRFYYIDEMSKLLGKSVVAIHGHLSRKQYDAVPPPMRLGRRLVWLVEAVDEWINLKVAIAKAELEREMKQIQTLPKKRGRPTKLEVVRKRRKLDETSILMTFETKNEKSK